VFFTVRPQLPKQIKVASLGRRLHRLGHRNVTIPLKTRWFTIVGMGTLNFASLGRLHGIQPLSRYYLETSGGLKVVIK
jgi:hypothetical protein